MIILDVVPGKLRQFRDHRLEEALRRLQLGEAGRRVIETTETQWPGRSCATFVAYLFAEIIPTLLLEPDRLSQPFPVPADFPNDCLELACEICPGFTQPCPFRPRWPWLSEMVGRGPLALAKGFQAPPQDLVHLLGRPPVTALKPGGRDRDISLTGGEPESSSRSEQEHEAVHRLRDGDVVAVKAQRHGRCHAVILEVGMPLAPLCGDMAPPLVQTVRGEHFAELVGVVSVQH